MSSKVTNEVTETKSTRARTAIRKAASEPPALIVFFQNSTLQKVEPMDLHSDALSWPVYRLHKTVEDLLFFLECPDAETTGSKDWLEKISAQINHDFQAVAIALTDAAESERISRMRVEATHFANVLNANPGIRLIQWTESFPDCLPRLRAFQRELKAIETAPKDHNKGTGRCLKLVTVDDVAAMLVDVEAKTLHNSDVKKWGDPDGKVNRSRAWNLERIRPIIEQTRQFKDV